MNTIQTCKLLRENLASFYDHKFKYALGVEATEPRYRKNHCLEYGLYSVKKPHLAFRYYTGTSWPVRLFNAQIPDDDYVCIKGHMCVKDSILYKSPRMTLVEEVPYMSAFKCLKNSSKDLVDRIVNAGLNLEDDCTREDKVTSLAANLCEQLGLDSSPVIIRDRDAYDDVIRAVTYHPGSKGYELANQGNLTKKTCISILDSTSSQSLKDVRVSFMNLLESLTGKITKIPHHFSTPFLSFPQVSLLTFRESECDTGDTWETAFKIYELGYGITGFNRKGQLSLADLRKTIKEGKPCYAVS